MQVDVGKNFDVFDKVVSIINRNGSFQIQKSGDRLRPFGRNDDLEEVVASYGGKSTDDTLYKKGYEVLEQLVADGVLTGVWYMINGRISGNEAYEREYVSYFPHVVLTVRKDVDVVEVTAGLRKD